jgi:O-antigen biosynthesis protein WbqV
MASLLDPLKHLPPRARWRIAVNVILDALLAALAVPLAAWIASPERMPLGPIVAPLGGAAALLIGGLPFRLAFQYWRFVGAWELVAVAASSALGAGLFAAGLYGSRVGLPSPSFPVAHVLALFSLLTLPRVIYRLLRETPMPAAGGAGAGAGEDRRVLLLGAGEGANRFLSALAADAASPYRAVGLLSARDEQIGRRIQGVPVLGTLADAPDALARLRGSGDAPQSLVVTDPTLEGAALDRVLSLAHREGLSVGWAPRPTTLDARRPGPA